MQAAEKKKDQAYVNSLQNLNPISSQTNLDGEYKRIILEYDSDIKVTLFVKRKDDTKLSCQWLLTEAKKEFREIATRKKIQIDISKIVALQTKPRNYLIDYCLTLPHTTLSSLEDGTVLVPYLNKKPTEPQPKNAIQVENIPQASLKDFEFITLLGKGGFGKVYLARMKENGSFYAIKKIRKRKDPKKVEEEKKEVQREKFNLLQLKFPYFVHLHYEFETEKNFYFALDFVAGGDLHHLLRDQVVFTEHQAKFYIAEALAGLQVLHSHKFIHRDLKPQNLLLDLEGHIHFADFGLIKPVKSRYEYHYTFCGTLEYMAPEVMTGHGYNYLADYYSLGVLTYEFVVGVPPFQKGKEEDNDEFFQKVVIKKPKIPAKLSSECRSFILGLLEKDPNHRLGAKKGIKDLIGHPWFAGLDFEAIVSRKATPPLKTDTEKLIISKAHKRSINLDEDELIEQKIIEDNRFKQALKPRTLVLDVEKLENTAQNKQRRKSENIKPKKVKVWQRVRKKLAFATLLFQKKAILLKKQDVLVNSLDPKGKLEAGLLIPRSDHRLGTAPKDAIFGVGPDKKNADDHDENVTDAISDDRSNIKSKIELYNRDEPHNSQMVDWKLSK